LARGSVKVLDFGIAKLTAVEGSAAATASLTKTGTLLGTPYYMSPEQAKGMKRIDHRSDIWSLGVTMYQCLSGEIPTRGKTFVEVFKRVVLEPLVPIEKLVPDVPADIAKLIGRMLTREPAGRPWDLREVHDALERHANEKAPSFATAVAIVDEPTG